MTLRVLIQQVREIVGDAVKSAGYPAVEFDVTEPPQKEFGDLSCNVAFLLSKPAKKPPPRVATELVEALKPRVKDTYILSAEPAGGHINFKADYARLSPTTPAQVLKKIEEGKSEIARFAAEIAMRVLDEQLKACWVMKARYDLLNFESQIVMSNL